MDNHFNTPAEVIDLSIKACENKTRLPLGKMILLGIMAGAFIAFGGATSSTAAHAVENVGVARALAGCIFPICAFVVGGFEHCVANMFYIPAGILASLNPAYVAKAEEAYGITAEQIATLTPLHSLANFIPVTLGNMLGGMIFVGLPLYLIYKKNWENK